MKYYIPIQKAFISWDKFVEMTGYRPGDKYIMERVSYNEAYFTNVRNKIKMHYNADRFKEVNGKSHLPSWF